MGAIRFAAVPTALGAFGVAWSEVGIVRTWLHERTEGRTRAAVLRELPGAVEATPPPDVADAVADVVALLAGERRLPTVALDQRSIPAFDQRVYAFARTILPGETVTYGAVARALGEEPMRARDVGVALARNPFAPIVPCHRIVAANGSLGGYSAPGGAATKRRLLELEGAAIVAPPPPPAQVGLFDEPAG
ncbi:MAG TPA: methylated-DNA--[protein]-cysteine S-methyltransferase [Candidatus Limnocylindrales bacterium]|nr:methylated-DNA--[protein]-cysteine S-methyltransferase [Candidatus Limnocylindrales bacterium]